MNVYFQSGLISLFLVGCGMVTLRAETPEEWAKLGARVNSGGNRDVLLRSEA